MADEEEQLDEALAEVGPNPKIPLVIGLMLGLFLGGGGAAGYFLFLTPPDESVAETEVVAVEEVVEPYFFELNRLTAPLLNNRRKIVGYVHLDVNLEVHDEDLVNFLDVREPILRHAANAALAEMGAGREDQPAQVDYDGVSALLAKAVNEALPENIVKAVHVKSGTRL